MRVARLLLAAALAGELLLTLAAAQESAFELPVQLIGFPVIIMAVRLANFVKKLAYSINPRTYVRRARRDTPPDPALDALQVEKRLVAEFGEHVCVYEQVCEQYAQHTKSAHGRNHVLDWQTVFSEYKSSPLADKQNYLLSVFLGDIVASPGLCHQLAKRGRACKGHLHQHHLRPGAASQH